MDLITNYILIALIPFLGNLSGFIVSSWSSEELKELHKYIDIAIRLIVFLMIGLVLFNFQFLGILVLAAFTIFIFSKDFWKHQTLTLFIIACLNILSQNVIIFLLTFVYVLLDTSLNYYVFNKTKKIRLSHYGLYGINFLKKYWKYYMFLLIIELFLLVLIVI